MTPDDEPQPPTRAEIVALAARFRQANEREADMNFQKQTSMTAHLAAIHEALGPQPNPRAAAALVAFAEMARAADGDAFDVSARETFDRLLREVLWALEGERMGNKRLGTATGAIAALRAAFLRRREP